MIWTAWLIGMALAQEPPSSDAVGAGDAPVQAVEEPVPGETDAPETEASAPAPFDDRVSTEVIVYGERLIEAARQEVIEQAARDGYVREIRKADRTILRHDLPWRGDVVLYDDGRLDIKRQPVRFEPPVEKKTPASYLICVFLPACIRPNGQLVSKNKFEGYKRMVMASIEPEVRVWNERISDHAIQQKVEDIPGRLEALWTRGQPLDGGERLVDHAARRAAIFAFWDSRTDTTWGHDIQDAVAAFVRGEVQASDHPYGEAELRTLDAQRRSRRPFPVEPVGP